MSSRITTREMLKAFPPPKSMDVAIDDVWNGLECNKPYSAVPHGPDPRDRSLCHPCGQGIRSGSTGGSTMNPPALPIGYIAPVKMPHGRLLTCRGIQIGGAIPRAMPTVEGDALGIQAALLDTRTARPLPFLQRAAGAVWRWL